MTADSSGTIFVDGLTNSTSTDTKLKDLKVGEKFVFMGRLFTRINDLGFAFGFMNIRDESGGLSHLSPYAPVSRLN